MYMFICFKTTLYNLIVRNPGSDDIDTNEFLSVLEDSCSKLHFYSEIHGTDFCCIGTGKNFLIKNN